MTSTAMGEGERAEARRLARVRAMIGGSMVCALLIVGAALLFKQSGGRIAPAGAITIVLLYLAAMVSSFWYACRKTDEVEARDTIVAVAVGGGAYGLVYPAWYFLWRGGLVSEPSHEALYLMLIVVITLAYFWKRLR
jgi:hypothetical protein